MSRTLTFNTPGSIAAARHIVSSPPLAYSPFVVSADSEGLDGRRLFHVRVQDRAVLSSGESECLVPMLEAFSSKGAFLDPRSLFKLDLDTRMTACQALLLYAGVISEVVTAP